MTNLDNLLIVQTLIAKVGDQFTNQL